MAKKKPDFQGFATRANIKCADGRTIMKNLCGITSIMSRLMYLGTPFLKTETAICIAADISTIPKVE